MTTFVLPLSDTQATLETVGGKGMSLAKLTRAGLPVPTGFHITTDAYRQFVAENGIQPRILAALQGLDPSNPAALEAASRQIGGFFAQGRIPPELIDVITNAYSEMLRISLKQPAAPVAVAIRSSATAEDLPEASFAGQQDTYLNIRGAEAVLDAVQRCWASLWTARAIAYRARQGIDPDAVALAVVVQELVFADAAGVLFTANPITGQRSEMMLTATWGLGEAIVSGAVTPDTLIVQKSTGKVIQRQTAEKQVMTIRTESGTHEIPVPDAQKKKTVLNNSQAAQLAKLGATIEKLYAMPMDIEWTLTSPPSPLLKGEGGFAIVQARPITALPEPPLEWPLPHPKAVLARGSLAEFVPEPVSPLFGTLAVPIARRETQRLMSEMGMTGEDNYIFTVLNDYVYVGMIFDIRLVWKMTAASLKVANVLFKTAKERAMAKRAKLTAAVQKWQALDLASLAPSELLAGVREIFTATAEYYTVAQSGTIPLSLTSEMTFGKYYETLVKRKGDPDTATFVFGSDNHAVRADKALFDLALWVKQQPELAEYILNTLTADLIPNVVASAPLSPDSPLPSAFPEFVSRLDAYLDGYGHAIYDLDFAKPVPAEAPAPLIEAIKVYLTGQNNPHERQQMALQRRTQAAEAIIKRLDPLRRKYFVKLLNWAQDTAPLREDSIADLGLGHPQIRRMLGELGRRLAAPGAIVSAGDVYWLEAQEADALAVNLEANQALPNLTGEVERRKAKWQAMRQITPPTTIPQKTWMAKFYPSESKQSDTIKGFAASAGKVTARACVMLGPEDFSKMQPGDVIVAGITTPAWTPLFARASAIVTDIGGPLSHSSIVAREYGIPAVLGAGAATRRIQHGQIITVDGGAGSVTLHENKSTTSTIIKWKPPDPKGVYMRGSVADLMPDPLSPLFITLGIPALRNQMRPLGARLTHAEPVLHADYFTSINDYAYMNANMPPRTWWWVLTGMLASYPKLLPRLVSIWRGELHPEHQAKVAQYQNKIPAEMPTGELWQDAQSLVDATMYYVCGLMFATMGSSAGSEMLLEKIYQKTAQRDGDPAVTALLMGWDSIPVRAEKSLYALAQWARQQPNLAEYILNAPTAELTPNSLAPASFTEFAARLEQHQKQFGHIIFQLDFAADLPLDHPELMLENIKFYLRNEAANPYVRQKASEEKRIQLTATLLGRPKGLKLWAFRKALNWAQSLSEIREDALAEIGLGYPILRAMLNELGKRLVDAGAIQNARDIYWLEKEAIEVCLNKLESGRALDKLSGSVADRKAHWNLLKRETPPSMMPMKERIMGFKVDIFVAQSADSQQDHRLNGVAASQGKVTAPACVLHGPEDFGKMKPGAVLVAGTTTPAWTPLFVMAAAVVTDIGGPLSHGSIVAREYGIPAVMGTGVATRRIRDGQMITVDGSAGVVVIEP